MVFTAEPVAGHLAILPPSTFSRFRQKYSASHPCGEDKPSQPSDSGGETLREELERAARYLLASRHAIALTGAGMSTESGIPDFRGPSGIWTKHPEEEARAYLLYPKFLSDPRAYWEEVLSRPSPLGDLRRYSPNPGHFALAELERMGILKAVITQNIDDLHRRAGSVRVLEYHGNTFKLRCLRCGARYPREEFDLEGMRREGRLPPRCGCGGPLKSDVVYFGEPIPEEVMRESLEEVGRCDLVLVCGTSAVVYPFARLPLLAKERGARLVEVNLEPTPLTELSDCSLRGRVGEILPALVERVRELRDKRE
jgi:NAD-dependent deacetylase